MKKKTEKQQELWQSMLPILVEIENADKKLGDYLECIKVPHKHYSTCRSYLLNVVRCNVFLDHFIDKHLKKTPKPLLRAFFKLVVGQLWQRYLDHNLNESQFAPLVNGWVDRAKTLFSKAESKCVNAVLRKVLSFFEQAANLPLDIRYSTSRWLIERYVSIFGQEETLQFLQWNEGFASIYIRSEKHYPFLEPTQWPHFYTLKDSTAWSNILQLLNEGKVYVQDPMTRIPVDMLQPTSGQSILDLCAAPGGKTRQIISLIGNTGCIVSVDLPEHMKRLQANTKGFKNIHLLPHDVLTLSAEVLQLNNLPAIYDGVIIDVPCSNTGVIRRKPDVLKRLTPADFQKLPALQSKLLEQSSCFVKPNGHLVYSTCSIDPDENEGVINRFLKKHPTFSLIASQVSLPWIVQHDGGGSFLLKRKSV